MENMQQNPAPANGGAKGTFDKVLTTAKQKGAKALLATKPFVDKLKALPKKVWIGIGAGVAALIVAIIVIAALNNTPTTPIKLAINVANNKKASKSQDVSLNQLNGFLEKEVREIYKIMKKSDEYKDYLEDLEEYYEEQIEDKKDEYGNNYKYSFKVEEKEKLDKDDLEEVEEYLENIADELKDAVKESKDWDSDDWDDITDEMGLSKSQIKKMISIMDKMRKTLAKAKVTAGYEITVTVKLTGSELDEPEENEKTFYVYKINGRWVSSAALSSLNIGF